MEVIDQTQGWAQAFLLFLTTIAGFAFQAWSSARQRRWEREERQELAKKTERVSEELSKKTEKVSQELTRKTEETRNELTDEILENRRLVEENTQISKQAFTEANRFNLKLASLTRQFDEIKTGMSDGSQEKRNQ